VKRRGSELGVKTKTDLAPGWPSSWLDELVGATQRPSCGMS